LSKTKDKDSILFETLRVKYNGIHDIDITALEEVQVNAFGVCSVAVDLHLFWYCTVDIVDIIVFDSELFQKVSHPYPWSWTNTKSSVHQAQKRSLVQR
jgi:hypothetical protein